ncbi:hypothetical protein DPMN_112633 [Dreissena polymorpha]|uniref:Uncharacterized protein n=1 Tax=Dreissena polymorpha TaxID=45954 RepID=A0A9D4KGQ3_DREPO|nr:hypothetical protein DPMN_112633 [Dreissena polymorpha]
MFNLLAPPSEMSHSCEKMPYAAREADDQSVQLESLVRCYHVRLNSNNVNGFIRGHGSS